MIGFRKPHEANVLTKTREIPNTDSELEKATTNIKADINMKAYRHAKRNLSAFSGLCAFLMA
jgi:hypothetical protein